MLSGVCQNPNVRVGRVGLCKLYVFDEECLVNFWKYGCWMDSDQSNTAYLCLMATNPR